MSAIKKEYEMNKTVNFEKYRHVIFDSPSKRLKYLFWLLISNVFFLTNIPYPNRFKVQILRLFGAKIGKNTVIKPWVKIKFPWELSLGNHVWIGEGVWIDNLSKVKIGDYVCISQGALLITGNHRYDREDFPLETKSILVEDGVWICAKSVIVGGIHLKSHAVVGLGCHVTTDLEAYSILQPNGVIKIRTIE